MNLAANKDIKSLLTAVEKAFKRLHQKGSYTAKDLLSVPEYRALLDGTNDILSGAIADNDIPSEMLESLYNDAFIFSGLKTHAQLLEASRLLLTDEGKVKSYTAFARDIEKLKSGYNQHYLEAEYIFAVTSSQMAGKWASLDTEYDLQYRTANDDRVRDTHRVLHNITLPVEDAFWLHYYPPNGWRCRCNAVQVRKGKNELSDSAKSIEAGKKATTEIGKNGKNKLEIFRFNPGAQKVVFPPTHPYNKVAGAGIVKAELKKEIEKTVRYVPEKLADYEKTLGVKVDREFFRYLGKETPLRTSGYKNQGAFYQPDHNFVHIPFDSRRKESKWKAESVVYHEYGHAADRHIGMRKSDAVATLMDKHRKILKQEKNSGYAVADLKLQKRMYEATLNRDYDQLEKVLAARDTLMSLNPNYGVGHTKAYFKQPYKKEAEFIAHAFENTFIGNNEFEEVLPELYTDMIEMIKGFAPE